MPKTYVITTNGALTASIKRYWQYVRGVEPIFILGGNILPESPLQAFHRIADAIEEKGHSNENSSGLRNAIAILDFCDPHWQEVSLDKLNPIQGGNWATVVAMLLLAFPEIHWVFLTPYKPVDALLFKEAHILSARNILSDILRIHGEGFTPLFDPTSLRNAIRYQIKETPGGTEKVAPYVPIRGKVAAAIDEEEPYAYFNAYTAYRFGFRSHVVSSYGMMGRLFKSNSTQTAPDKNPEIVFEDIYLNFPDRASEAHLSDLVKRDEEFSKLKKMEHRIFVTVGHKRTLEPDRWRRNKEHLQVLRDNGQYNKVLYKPFSGVFDLWKKSGLYGWLGYGKYKGLADGYKWPPPRATTAEVAGPHSAPGRLLEIAERLIQRAERILHTTITVEDSVYGALLALEAQELLGNRTPTTALEALAIRQQLEVIAECMFYGVESHLNVKERYKDIEREVRSIGYWFHSKSRKASELNAEIGILNHLILRFREYNQFDEEQQCLDRARTLERRFWFEKNKGWAWLFYPFRWYVEFLLGSIWRFLVVIVLWVVALGFLFQTICKCEPRWVSTKVQHGFIEAVTTFFGLQPAHEMKELLSYPASVWLVPFVIVAGFVHLGILISHLYSIIARR